MPPRKQKKSGNRESPTARARREKPTPEPARDSERGTGVDTALAGFFDDETAGEPEAGELESLPEPRAVFGVGRAELREELETDGPVLGGPGMIPLGADRAVASGTGGLAAGEDLDPVAEGDYWRENFRRSPYYAAETESQYEPAYRFGWQKAGQFEYRNRGFEEVELDLEREWGSARGEDESWEEARDVAREAWERARDRE